MFLFVAYSKSKSKDPIRQYNNNNTVMIIVIFAVVVSQLLI